ncbi:MAG: hypothetical protein SXV54_08290 [Chloroflexota bacterium]|nr:hypothetical protein [Chloroflexota bacterium]
MEPEQRIEILEREVETLKGDIREVLLEVQASLSDKPARYGSSQRWQKRAWGLALLNLLLAIVLFTNIHLYTLDTSLESDSLLNTWLQAFWVALAFVWLILQMYPLALLLDEENDQSCGAAWHNTITLFKSNPMLTLVLTASVLIVAIVSALFPSLWFVVVAVLFAVVCVNAAGHLRGSRKQRAQPEE